MSSCSFILLLVSSSLLATGIWMQYAAPLLPKNGKKDNNSCGAVCESNSTYHVAVANVCCTDEHANACIPGIVFKLCFEKDFWWILGSIFILVAASMCCICLLCQATDDAAAHARTKRSRLFREVPGAAGIIEGDPAERVPTAANFDQAMLTAAKIGHLAAVERLLAAGATALDRAMAGAAAKGHLAVVERLLAAGATDFDGAMREAAAKGRLAVVECLLAAGATDFDGAIESAATNGHIAVIERLMFAARVAICDRAMAEAARKSHLVAVEHLLATREADHMAMTDRLLAAKGEDQPAIAERLPAASDRMATV